jgi:hypothetical protein
LVPIPLLHIHPHFNTYNLYLKYNFFLCL